MEQVDFEPFSGPLAAVSALFDELHAEMDSSHPSTAFDAVTTIAVRRVEGAVTASITTVEDGSFRTVSAFDDAAVRADLIQYELGSGPCVDTCRFDTCYRPTDLRNDGRWPEYGPRVAHEVGFISMLSYRLNTGLPAGQLLASLNIYSDRPAAFDKGAAEIGLLLATHGALAIAAERHRNRAVNLERALESSRVIGIAVGVLMSQHKVSPPQAFDLLRIASQNSNRKLRDVASDVACTGTLPAAGGRDVVRGLTPHRA
jgi:ANTAR domain